ncbi:HNH endonuclease [bacterium]|nr:HNH endonuclease [bacterium]
MPDNWELDLLIHVGGDVLSQTKDILEENPDFCFECKRCRKELRPWDQDEIYVVTYHLEEHYGIPLETPGRKYPNKKMENQILNLYDRECFNCKSHDKQLTIDHILPQCAGGDSAFRNLQPLCVECQNIKGNTHPQVKEVWSKMYFGSYPSDSYEHMFW